MKSLNFSARSVRHYFFGQALLAKLARAILFLIIVTFNFSTPHQPFGSTSSSSRSKSQNFLVVGGNCNVERDQVRTIQLELVREEAKDQAGAAISTSYKLSPETDGKDLCSDFYGAYVSGQPLSVELAPTENDKSQPTAIKSVDFPIDYRTRSIVPEDFEKQKYRDKNENGGFNQAEQKFLLQTDLLLIRGQPKLESTLSPFAEHGEIYARRIEGKNRFQYIYCGVASRTDQSWKKPLKVLDEYARWCRIIGSPDGYRLDEWKSLDQDCGILSTITRGTLGAGRDMLEMISASDQDLDWQKIVYDINRVNCNDAGERDRLSDALELGHSLDYASVVKVEDAMVFMEETLLMMERKHRVVDTSWKKPIAKKVDPLEAVLAEERVHIREKRQDWERTEKAEMDRQRAAQ